MSKANFIKIYLTAYDHIFYDHRLSVTHVSLYFAILHFYNLSRFSNPFCVARSQLKSYSKIKSNRTYSKAIKELISYGYIDYQKSNSPHVGSLFSVIDLTKSPLTSNTTSSLNEPVVNQSDNKTSITSSFSELPIPVTSVGNELVMHPSKTYKQNNQTINKTENNEIPFSPPSQNGVIDFFKENKSSQKEGDKFYYHYTANGWKVGGKTPMVNWQASAYNWINRSANFSSPSTNYLDSEEDKDYTVQF